ncbi:MAG TPA: FMN-binding protein [Verrucomicrobia bacterium]|nr:FMN-binding protein [Verrucomicrobiota bacterium]HOP96201.1 FMN-binding protein [Verrucomicrobiota bacterium]HPU54674.1 FMN-binding protein [Verrucomicrobiota bacterium]
MTLRFNRLAKRPGARPSGGFAGTHALELWHRRPTARRFRWGERPREPSHDNAGTSVRITPNALSENTSIERQQRLKSRRPPHSRTLRVSVRLACIACVAFLLALTGFAPSAFAERYLTVAEAQRLCFPEADRFEEHTVRFTAEQRKAIEKRIGTRVLNRGNRIVIASKGTSQLGVLVIDHVLGKHEIIDYAVAIAPDGKVLQVEVLEYRESHGHEIRSPRWREQFKGKTADSKLRLNDDISNISGATISCRQVTEGVKRVLATFEVVLRPRPGAAGVPGDKS